MTPVEYPTPLAELPVASPADMRYPMLLQVPVAMRVSIPMPGISLRGLTQLRAGDIIVSTWPASGELPLYASNVALSWGEFEVVDDAIALRLTRLA
jgi:flagellar motor switch/type III secretory pathway protein FliN